MFAKFMLCLAAWLGSLGAAANQPIARIDINAVIYKMSEDEMKYESITDFFDKAATLKVYVEGISKEVEKGEAAFQTIIDALHGITKFSHEMPAFGVSIDALTKDDMKTGTWLELCFLSPQKHEGMAFESLLIRVEKEHFGFNLIRGNNERYDGRCFYLSLDNDMSLLYDALGNSLN